jgi:hypothetical protein
LTRLYIVGCSHGRIPDMPLHLGHATHVIASSTARQHRGHPQFRPEVTKAEREHTPPELAAWLVELARRTASAVSERLSNVEPQVRIHPARPNETTPQGIA